MPEVIASKQASPEARGATERADAILDSCRDAFALKGFDGASMQDLARHAGMSAGNFYRYFASKDAIIAALVEREMAEVEQVFAEILASRDPKGAFLAALAIHFADQSNVRKGALWADIEAAAMRREPVGRALEKMKATVIGCQMRLFALIAGTTLDDACDRFAAQAELVLLLIRGTAMSACQTANPHSSGQQALHGLVLTTIKGLLADISMQDRT